LTHTVGMSEEVYEQMARNTSKSLISQVTVTVNAHKCFSAIWGERAAELVTFQIIMTMMMCNDLMCT